MIPAATLKLGKVTHKLRLTTAALMRFEEDNEGQPFDVLLDRLIQGQGGIRLLVSALAAGLEDGQGVSKDEAMAMVDAAGGARRVVPFVAEAIGKAFPAPNTGQGADAATKPGADAAAGKARAPAGA
ncbi:GTA-gp10 family protein [Phaeobacter sp. B1627]|uniref:GTA-gp10 family protein n=1 Tax=Phaeobacter sp. B1627 TaxID=2583809 RepID=UPI001118A940|nr:GTA-gp10 family protein [Phaeobacter sp. B1627]TNJ39254.1 hypothetical protein FGE21_19085 [Phaeobacter sp. B1627]